MSVLCPDVIVLCVKAVAGVHFLVGSTMTTCPQGEVSVQVCTEPMMHTTCSIVENGFVREWNPRPDGRCYLGDKKSSEPRCPRRRRATAREREMTIDEIAKRIDQTIELLSPMRGNMEGDTSDETTIALGHALGSLVKARGLLLVDLAVIKRRKAKARADNSPE